MYKKWYKNQLFTYGSYRAEILWVGIWHLRIHEQ